MSTTTTAPSKADQSTRTTSKPERPETAKAKAARKRIVRDREARALAAQAKPESLVDFELPEVELVRKELDKVIVGLTVSDASAASMKCLRSYFYRNYFTKRIEGAQILSVRRVGLFLMIDLSTESTLVMSLGASGMPRWSAETSWSLDDVPLGDCEVLISFGDDGQLCFVDEIGTGQLFLVPTDKVDIHLPDTVNYGHDPLKPIAWIEMGKRLLQQDAELKQLLTNDEFLVGIGDVYADEILFEAGLRYDRLAATLTSQEVRRLHRALVNTLFDAMKYGGTSVEFRPFTSPLGRDGAYGPHLQIWGRDGGLSARSRTPIRREMYNGTWTYYCDTQV